MMRIFMLVSEKVSQGGRGADHTHRDSGAEWRTVWEMKAQVSVAPSELAGSS